MHLFGGTRKVNLFEKSIVVRMMCGPLVFLFKDKGIRALDRVSIRVYLRYFSTASMKKSDRTLIP